MQDYQQAWRKYRQITKTGFIALGLFFAIILTIVITSAYFENLLQFIFVPIIFAIFCLFIFIVNLIRIQYFRCPRCGEFFYKMSPFGTAGLNNHCAFCNLKLYENPSP